MQDRLGFLIAVVTVVPLGCIGGGLIAWAAIRTSRRNWWFTLLLVAAATGIYSLLTSVVLMHTINARPSAC